MSNTDLDILYEDNHLIAINKKSGDIVQGDKTGDEPLSEKLKKFIKKKESWKSLQEIWRPSSNRIRIHTC